MSIYGKVFTELDSGSKEAIEKELGKEGVAIVESMIAFNKEYCPKGHMLYLADDPFPGTKEYPMFQIRYCTEEFDRGILVLYKDTKINDWVKTSTMISTVCTMLEMMEDVK